MYKKAWCLCKVTCGGVGIKFSALKVALHVASTAGNKLDKHKKKQPPIKELQWMYHRNCFSHGVRSRNHIHRFQSEVPYLISSLLSQGFPEKIEKPRVQLRSLRPRPNDELFLRWTKLEDLLKESTAFPNVTCDSHRTSVMLLKPFFQGQVDITKHSRYFQQLCREYLKKS